VSLRVRALRAVEAPDAGSQRQRDYVERKARRALSKARLRGSTAAWEAIEVRCFTGSGANVTGDVVMREVPEFDYGDTEPDSELVHLLCLVEAENVSIYYAVNEDGEYVGVGEPVGSLADLGERISNE